MALPHTKTSGAARMAVLYITVGALTCVWTVIWYIWMNNHGTQSDAPYYWCYGFFLTGLTLMIIGLALGRIGRAARHAEAPADATASNPTQQALQQAAAPAAHPAATPAAPGGSTAAPAPAPGGAAAPPGVLVAQAPAAAAGPRR
jgi:hypothetical protein